MLCVRAGVATALLVAVGIGGAVGGCASVPKEAVELSYQMGEDLDEIQVAFETMVRSRFADFRARRVDYLEHEWVPTFLEDFIVEGHLVDIAKGTLVWDDANETFVQPTSGQEETQRFDSLRTWTGEVTRQIEKKRAELLTDLDAEEARVLADLRDAFGRLKRANAHITAHLNSIREVQEVQAEALDRLGIREVVDDLNSRVIQASEWAESGLEKIRAADQNVDEAAGALGVGTEGGE